MTEHRNMLLALLLSAVVLVGWSFLSTRYFQPANPPSTKVVEGKQVPVPQPGANAAADSAGAVRNRATVLRETPRVAIETRSLQGSINLKGARIDDLLLLRHRVGIEKDSPPIRLLSPSGSLDAYFGGFGWSGEGVALPDANTVWSASAPKLTPGAPVTLSWNNGAGQLFQIIVSVDDDYMFGIDQKVSNTAAGAVAVRPYALVNRIGVSKDPDSWTMHTGPVGVLDGTVNFVNFDTVDEGEQRFATTGGWIGFGDKYWLTAVIPNQGGAIDASFRTGQNRAYQADYAAPATIIPPGKAASYQSRFFAGAKEVALLDSYEAQNVPLFSLAIDWGWFRIVEKPIFYLLDWLFRQIGNFGVAIICLTFIIRGLMFPIAQKQFKSFAAMRVLQPKMKVIQDRHKDDKVQMQQAIMQLYKEEKANPLAGCLPILLQIPIFYALYKVLMLTIEMRHQPFALWIKDLSAPDPMTPVNLFGFLPFDPPTLIAIGVLPILVGFTMWLLQKLSPAAPDPVQQQVMMVMPWLLMFIFASLAAGLQLYYVVNNLLSLAQQSWLYRRYPGLAAKPEPAK